VITFLALGLVTNLQAQRQDSPYLEDANRLRAIFKDNDVATLEYTSSYSFSMNTSRTLMRAQGEESAVFISLKANAIAQTYSYFNNHQSIASYTLKNEKGRVLQHDKFCGHIEREGIFYSDAQVCSYRWQMPLPGQYARFETTLNYDDTRYLTTVYFHDEIPSAKRTLKFYIPDWADIELKEMNFTGYDVQKTVVKQNSETVYTYTLAQVRGLPQDGNLPGYSHFLPHIVVLTKGLTIDGKKVNILADVNDLYRWYQELTAGMKKDDGVLKPQVEQILKGINGDEEKIRALFHWVQDNIKYIAFEDGLAAFKPEDSHEVLYKRYGDCKGMANLLKEMLILAGYDARLTWIGTDRIAYTFETPTLAVNNHMICTVMLPGKKLILDPTNKYGAFNEMGDYIQNKEILIESGDQFILDKVPQEPMTKYLEESVASYSLTQDQITGTGSTTLHGDRRNRYLSFINSIDRVDYDRFLKWLVAGSGNTEFFTVEKPTDTDRDKPIRIQYKVHARNQVYQNDKELYLDLDLTDDFKNARIEKGRIAPFKFQGKTFQKSTVELALPNGFKVSHLPDAYSITTDYFSFSAKYTTSGNKLVYQKEIRILKTIIPVSEFTNWNTAIDGLRKFYNDQIILTSHD
jgi:hypothetical protein